MRSAAGRREMRRSPDDLRQAVLETLRLHYGCDEQSRRQTLEKCGNQSEQMI